MRPRVPAANAVQKNLNAALSVLPNALQSVDRDVSRRTQSPPRRPNSSVELSQRDGLSSARFLNIDRQS